MKRKFLAALLALVMVFSMIPVSASADGTIYEGIPEKWDGTSKEKPTIASG